MLSLWICRSVPGPFQRWPDVSSIEPMPGRFWHIAANLQGCLVFVRYVELFWCYVSFVCTASPVSTATECRNEIVTKNSLRYLSHIALTASNITKYRSWHPARWFQILGERRVSVCIILMNIFTRMNKPLMTDCNIFCDFLQYCSSI